MSKANLKAYERLRPILFKLDPETAHNLLYTLAPVAGSLAPLIENLLGFNFEHKLLELDLFGTRFKNPIGLAAGFDKNAKLGSALDILGLGFAEIGSISYLPAEGYPKPRVFRLPADDAIINRLGLNGEGVDIVARRLLNSKCRTPQAANLVKTNDPNIKGDAAIADLVNGFFALAKVPMPYLTINFSCPNTEVGIRKEIGEISAAISQIQAKNVNKIPIVLKLSPDSSDSLLESILSVGREHKIAGYVCGNTTITRHGLKTDELEVTRIGQGGLSGKPLQNLSYDLCKRVIKLKEPDQKVIACGGIDSAQDVFKFLELGACAVQLYTALVYRGPKLIRAMKEKLVALLEKEGTSVTDLTSSAKSVYTGI